MKSKFVSLPYVIWMIVFITIPLLLVVFFSFTNENGIFTLEWITRITKYFPVLLKSIWLALIATIISFVLGFPLSFIISRSNFSKQKTLLMLVMLPMWMNFLLRTYAWLTLLENNGIINKLLGYIGLGPFELINTQGAVVLGMVYNYIPFMILPLYSIMTKIDKSVIEASQDLGANGFKVLTKIILPLSLPGIISGITMVFVPSVSTFIISRMLGGGTSTLIGDIIEEQFIGNTYNPNLGSALSLMLMVIILIIMGITNRFDNKEMKGVLL